ncbi:uncharacterized protein LOC125196365 [Salvia hispanica]|uniref:uncharacterized protein LOC125196365 n=1 Tax=Salvia hispanica TaxID=49212 RepID=UPI0020098A07|nr:uncharacterized protein LOC125196365 [Salvia hispanica]
MSDTDENETNSNTNQSPISFSASQFAELMRLITNPTTPTPIPQSKPSQKLESLGDVTVTTKLDGDNYHVWVTLMERAIGGKGLTSHISGVSDPPSITDPMYPIWQQRDHCCFNWIINNIETSLVNEVSQYKTAGDLWDALATTYDSGADPFQVSDLHRQAYGMKQGNMTLEALWQKFQDLWLSIDRRDPNPMDTPSTIEKYNQNTQRHRVYQFLWALDERYDQIKREILNKDPLPSVRATYGIVRREAVNDKLIKAELKESGIATGLGTFDRSRSNSKSKNPPLLPPKFPTNRRDEDKLKLTCSHCGGKKHTRDTCFHIHGFPEWWEDMKKARQNRGTNRGGNGGRAAVAVGERAANAEGSTAGSIVSQSRMETEQTKRKLWNPFQWQGRGLKDIKTGMIVGRGTERSGLYYVDEIAQ